MDHHSSSQRNRLTELHGRLRRLAERRGLDEALVDLDEAARRLREMTFRLAVLGEYKRGKSTLINALLGQAVLPVGIVPLTSIITEVRYRSRPGATVEFLDGRSTAIGLDDLAAYVTEPENPHNRKGVRRAIVHHPASFLAEGVAVLDTPGVGSVFDHNTELTYGALEASDAVIIVLAADQPLSAEERGLLRALSGITDRILFVVNRADVLTGEELAKSLAFIGASLEALDGSPAKLLYALSARSALEARRSGRPEPTDFERFSRDLHGVLIERKSAILLDRAVTITRRAAGLLVLRLEAERAASRLAESELERAIDQFRNASARISEQLEESVALFRHQVARIHRIELRRLAEERKGKLDAELWPPLAKSLQSRESPRSRGWADRLALELGRQVVGELRPYYHESEEVVSRGLHRALEEHMVRVREAIRESVETANRVLGMRIEAPLAVAPLPDRPTFYFKDWDGAGGQFRGSRWWLRLPRRWGERQVLRQFRELLDRRISQNLAGIHYDWVARLEQATRAFEASTRAQLDATQRTIAEALAGARRLGADRADGSELNALSEDLAESQRLSRNLREIATGGGHSAPAGPDPLPTGPPSSFL